MRFNACLASVHMQGLLAPQKARLSSHAPAAKRSEAISAKVYRSARCTSTFPGLRLQTSLAAAPELALRPATALVAEAVAAMVAAQALAQHTEGALARGCMTAVLAPTLMVAAVLQMRKEATVVCSDPRLACTAFKRMPFALTEEQSAGRR